MVLVVFAGVVWSSRPTTQQHVGSLPPKLTTPLLRVNLNEADERELSLLPSIGPTIARRIIENRERLGPFHSLDDLGRIHGIGEKSIEKLRAYCHVDEPPPPLAIAQTP